MKKILLLFVALIAACTQTGCSQLALLQNDAGDMQRCEVSGSEVALLGKWQADRNFNNCIKLYKNVGYRRIQ